MYGNIPQRSYSSQEKQNFVGERSSGQEYTVTEIPIQRGNSDLGSKSEERISQPIPMERKEGTASREALGSSGRSSREAFGGSGRSSREAISSGRDSIGKISTGSNDSKQDKSKKDKKSFSSIFKIFRKKSSKDDVRKKSSLSAMLEKSSSVISPDVQKTIIEGVGDDRDQVSPTRKINFIYYYLADF